ncbi:transglutaminase-like domain-containing protein [Cecembia rubra]|uniref:Transglutaminase-like putative cysteine protease n=1 Tax=Cecembia rubra TaxID=1485585 RepID=A0A2P8DZG1_9BACT|nr:transglutaminase-like domain-containing protein [Cecembia rubra]PSL02595.1 transglutaminase-like putative cysteine protease [Cecembia rubra]
MKFKKQIFSLSILLFCMLAIGCQQSKRDSLESEAKENLSKKKVSIEEIEDGIKAYIEQEKAINEGFFLVNDEKVELRLKLVRVHTEYLSNLGPSRHFACVDLADEKGDVYDVDFFLEGEPGNMKVTETSLHKLNGKPRYSWKQLVDKTWKRVPVESSTNDLFGVKEGRDYFEFSYKAFLPKISANAKVWIPIAQTDRFQEVKIKSIKVPGKQSFQEEKKFGNTILVLDVNQVHSGEEIEIVYEVARKEKGPYLDSEEEINKYLEPDLLLPVGGRFKEIAENAIKGKENDGQLVHARALYDYIIDNMRYMKFGTYGTGSADFACDSKTGNCTEFHSFFISLARSIGIPARFAIGASIPSERNEGGIDGYHCWAEFYAEGKWWPVDISEGNKYTALATYYFGRHPANRIELSRGRDLVLSTMPKAGPINFLAYPIMEEKGELLYPKTVFSFNRIN